MTWFPYQTGSNRGNKNSTSMLRVFIKLLFCCSRDPCFPSNKHTTTKAQNTKYTKCHIKISPGYNPFSFKRCACKMQPIIDLQWKRTDCNGISTRHKITKHAKNYMFEMTLKECAVCSTYKITQHNMNYTFFFLHKRQRR